MNRYNNFFKNVSLADEYKNSSDVKLLTEDGGSFEVHRIILEKENSYFKALFKHSKENTIILRDLSCETLDQILSFIYTKIVPTDSEKMLELFIASDYLLVDELKQFLKKYLIENITIENCVKIHLISLQIKDEELICVSYRFIQTHFQVIILLNSFDFEEIDLECLEQFLQDSNLFIAGEHIVWTCIKKWIDTDLCDRLSELPRLLKCLKSADVDEALAETIAQSNVVSQYAGSVGCRIPDILKQITGDNSESHRLSRRLHVVVQKKSRGGLINATMFITYDENIDLWKRLVEIKTFPTYVTVVGHNVYIIDSDFHSYKTFDLQLKEFRNMTSPRWKRVWYITVKLGENIFILGGLEKISYDWTGRVDYYNTETGR